MPDGLREGLRDAVQLVEPEGVVERDAVGVPEKEDVGVPERLADEVRDAEAEAEAV